MRKYGTEEQRRQYVDGFMRYESKGIPIYIDGRKPGEKEWENVFRVHEDGGFYMCDYVGNEKGELKEIHFDRVYNR